MGADDVLFFIIICGVMLTIAYLRDQLAMQRRYRMAERGSKLRLRELYRSRPQTQFKDPSQAASEPGICQIGQRFKLSLESPITRR